MRESAYNRLWAQCMPSAARSAKIFPSNPWCQSCGTVVLLTVPVEASPLSYRGLFLLLVLLKGAHLFIGNVLINGNRRKVVL